MNSLRIILVMALFAASAPVAVAQSPDSSRADSPVGLVKPWALTQFAIADSARYYARKYEYNQRRRVDVALIGGSVFALGFVAAIPHPCQEPWCTVRTPSAVNWPLVGIGLTTALTSLVFKARAAEAGMRASWWHDAALAH